MNFQKLKELFEQNADKKEAEGMSAYMQNKFAFFGIPKPKREMLTKKLFADDKNNPFDWKFVFDCFAANEREYQYTALNYLKKRKEQLSVADISNIKKLVETKSWWDSVDCLD